MHKLARFCSFCIFFIVMYMCFVVSFFLDFLVDKRYTFALVCVRSSVFYNDFLYKNEQEFIGIQYEACEGYGKDLGQF